MGSGGWPTARRAPPSWKNRCAAGLAGRACRPYMHGWLTGMLHLSYARGPALSARQAEDSHARVAKQSTELAAAIAAAREREAAAQQQLKAAEDKLREAVQRDEK